VALLVLPPSLGAAKAEARAEHLAAVLTRELERTIDVVVCGSYAELRSSIESGAAALAWAPAAVCAELASGEGRGVVQSVHTIVRSGRSRYRSAILARRADRLTLVELGGKRAAWVDPLSAGGYLLAMALLRSRAIDPAAKLGTQRFLGSHRAVVEALLHETADIGAVSVHGLDDEAVAASIRWYVGAPGDRLEPLAISASCPNDAIVLTTRAGSELRERFVERFVDPGTRAKKSASGEHARWSSAASSLMQALEGERLETTDLAEYVAAFEDLATTGAKRPSRAPGA
jgi:ABC-type phosphate/phosphonate transport system substrate-binding protein